MRLGDLSNSRSNSFDLIRFIAATMVIWAHSAAFTQGIKAVDPVSKFLHWQFGSGAVEIFFIISGFLISQSCERSSNPISYLTARFLRIFPGLLICLLFCILIIGPLATTLPLSDYFKHKNTWRFLTSNITLYNCYYFLPGVFAKIPYPKVVNHSLWTLYYEFLWYLIVLLMGTLRQLKVIPVVLLFVSLLAADHFGSVKIYGLVILHIIHLGVFFSAGMVIYVLRDRIRINKRIAIISFILMIVTEKFVNHTIAMAVFGNYLIFAIAYLLPKPCHSFSKHGDFSYGIYIYAYAVQQFLVFCFNGKMVWYTNFIASFAITLILAYASWHLVEKGALANKKNVSEWIWNHIPNFAKQDLSRLFKKRIQSVKSIDTL